MQAYAVVSGYSKDVVDALKGVIPAGDRDWDPNTKTWYVKEKYGTAIRSIAENAFGVGSVSFVSKQVAEQTAKQYTKHGPSTYTSPGTGTTEDALVAFFGLMSYNAAKQAYRFAASELHPDKADGDPQKMAKLNELWSRIEKEFYKR